MLPILLLAAAASFPSAVTAAPQPNLLVLMADDLGYADLGFQGCHDIPTVAYLSLNTLPCRG